MQNLITKLEHNVRKNYLYAFISNFGLTHGIWMLYLASKGLNLFQIGIMETVYHVSSFSMEIPTGIVADMFGRKTSRSLGRLMNIVSIIIMIYGDSVFAFGLSFFFTAMGNNLESGAGDALIYDSLKEIDKENEYMKCRGRNEIFYQLSNVGSLLIGGYIATFSYLGAYKISLVIAVVTFLQTLSFTEPTIGKVNKEEGLYRTFIKQLKTSVKILMGDKRLWFLILSLEVFATFYTTEFFYIQNYMKLNGNTEFQIGIVLASGGILGAFVASRTHLIEKRFKMKGILTIAPILAMICFWGMTVVGVEKYFFILLSMAEGVLFVSVGDYINKLIPSEQRATILSFQSMVFSVYMIILFPIVGKIGDVFGLNMAFKLIAVVSTLALLNLVWTVRRNKGIEV